MIEWDTDPTQLLIIKSRSTLFMNVGQKKLQLVCSVKESKVRNFMNTL